MLQLKWKMIVVWCFYTATIEWFLRGVQNVFGLDSPRKIILFVVVVAYLTVRIFQGNLGISTLLEGVAINLLASLLLSE